MNSVPSPDRVPAAASPPPPARLYKLMSVADWRAAVAAGGFTGSPADAADGFIHFSTAEQVVETAARHFADEAHLVLLTVAGDRLPGSLRMEPARDGALFPHLYGGSIPVAAVLAADLVPVRSGGGHDFSACGLPWTGEL